MSLKSYLPKTQMTLTTMHNPTNKRRDPTEPIRPRQPWPLKMVLLGILVAVSIGWLRFAGAIQNRSLILEFVSPAQCLYLTLSGLLWGLAGLPALWGAIRRTYWAPPVIWVTAVFYPVSYWFERLVLWVNPEAQANHGFMLLLTGLWFLLVFWALRLKGSDRAFNSRK